MYFRTRNAHHCNRQGQPLALVKTSIDLLPHPTPPRSSKPKYSRTLNPHIPGRNACPTGQPIWFSGTLARKGPPTESPGPVKTSVDPLPSPQVQPKMHQDVEPSHCRKKRMPDLCTEGARGAQGPWDPGAVRPRAPVAQMAM